MTVKEQIKWRQAREKESAALAAKYAKSKDYAQAAIWYRAADFHRTVWQALKIEIDLANE